MKKKIFGLMMATTLSAAMLAGCGNDGDTASTNNNNSNATEGEKEDASSGEKEDVKLTVWGAEEDQKILKQMVDSFKEEYADKANFDISVGVESESTAKDTILKDVEAAADVFAFADDQLNVLVAAKALQTVDINKDAIIEANGGADAGSIQAATYDGTLYAYPMTADNGYCLFYNKEYFTEEDVQSMDKMLEIAEQNKKKVFMQLNEGWYLYSFFQAAGLEAKLNEDGVTNYCTWNSTDGKYKGTDVAQAILDIAGHKGFISTDDAAFVSGLKDGEIIAGVTGTWNAETAEKAWGENFAACKLPTFTLAGDQVQMASFAGYKMVGVNAYSKFTGYAELLAEWITNYDNQVLRFKERGLGPSNVEAAASDEVKASPAIAAIAEQSQFASVQRIGDKYWDPVKTFGAIMAAGNKDKTDLQVLLDTMVEGITAPVE